MGTKLYQAIYARLLWLYPRAFRQRFGEEMTQTFRDLCREHRGIEQATFVLGVYGETLAGILKEHGENTMAKTMLRVALVALALVMIPLVASRLIDDWNWPPQTFVILFLLLFGIGMVFSLIARRFGTTWEYKAGIGVALASGFVLAWSNMVHVAGTENPANLIYYSVLVVGMIGAALARLQARGLSLTLFAMAATLAVISLLLPSGAPPDMAQRMAIGHGVLVALFTASGLLFRKASLLYPRP